MKYFKLTNKLFIIIIVFLFLIALFFLKPKITGYSVFSKNSPEERIILGYCPTMEQEAKAFAEKNNYELREFASAGEVLTSLKNNQINKGIIGRKAKDYEITSEIKESPLKSGYTLVMKEKNFIQEKDLQLIEVHTYLPEDAWKKTIPDLNPLIISKEEVSDKVKSGKVVLIFWEDWEDEFELLVVMQGNEKVKYFRGVFLYES